MTVITISRQYGSGGDEIADRICKIMGYQHFDKQHIARAAVEAGLSEQEIASYSDYSEENYKVKRFLDRLMSRPASGTRAASRKEDPVKKLLKEEILFNEKSALILVQKAIKTAYLIDNIVIVGRGGQAILKDYPQVLHVRIEAPLDVRIQRVRNHIKEEQEIFHSEYRFHRDAQEIITERDTASADYVRLFYGINWADTSLYHVVLNTGKMSIEHATRIIANMTICLFAEDAAHPS
jgi:CMP/dCMP kinase